jgi:hypothetical protein
MRTEYLTQQGWFFNAGELYASWLAELVDQANDPACWAALSALAKAAPTGERLDILAHLWPPHPPDAPDPARAARLRFALQFLNDRSSNPAQVELWGLDPTVEVRDYAASLLARAYRIGLEWNAPPHVARHGRTLGPLSRLTLREAVRHLAARELAANK